MRLIITFSFLLGALSLSAQSISGNLSSESTEDALGYGNVDIYQNDKLVASVLTDRLGNFNVALDTGTYQCVINYADHLPIKKEIRVVSDETADFSMERDPTKPVAPKIATEEPTMDPVDIGVLKAITEATMITTRLMVFPTAWVTGLTFPRAKKATSLYA